MPGALRRITSRSKLVNRIGEGVQQAHGDRLDPLGEQCVDGALGIYEVRAALDVPVGIDALVTTWRRWRSTSGARLGPGQS